MLRDFCVAHEVPLNDVILSPSTIKEIRKEVEAEASSRIKVGAFMREARKKGWFKNIKNLALVIDELII